MHAASILVLISVVLRVPLGWRHQKIEQLGSLYTVQRVILLYNIMCCKSTALPAILNWREWLVLLLLIFDVVHSRTCAVTHSVLVVKSRSPSTTFHDIPWHSMTFHYLVKVMTELANIIPTHLLEYSSDPTHNLTAGLSMTPAFEWYHS